MKRDRWVEPARWLILGVESAGVYLLLLARHTPAEALVWTIMLVSAVFIVVIYFVEGGRPS